jgi:hypothetical protein
VCTMIQARGKFDESAFLILHRSHPLKPLKRVEEWKKSQQPPSPIVGVSMNDCEECLDNSVYVLELGS